MAESELLLLSVVESVLEADRDDVELEEDDDEAVEEEEPEVLEVLDALEVELVLDADVDDVLEVRITLEIALAAELAASPMLPITLVALDVSPLRACLCARICPSIQVEIGEVKECRLAVAEYSDIPLVRGCYLGKSELMAAFTFACKGEGE